MKHRIEITTAQAKIMRDALEMYARVLKGQSFGITDNLEMDWRVRDEFNDVFNKVYSRSKTMDDKSSISWDLYQSVRHSVAWLENPDGGIHVCFDRPMKTSTEPLARVELVSE